MSLALPLAFALLLAGTPAPAPAPVNNATVPHPAPAPPSPSLVPNGARLGLAVSTFDVGEVTRPEKISHDFVVTNPGTGDLMLEVRPSCGCTVADYDKVVGPGKSGKITLSVDTTRFEGKVTKMATLTTNDPEKATQTLSIGGTIKVPPPAPGEAVATTTPIVPPEIAPAKTVR